MAKTKKETVKQNVVVAREADGTVQITFTIPWDRVEKERLHAAEHIAADMTIPGFRKGKAPISKALEKIAEERLVEHTLSHILPELFSEVIKTENLRPAVYPRYSLLKAKLNEDWEVRAVTCEIPQVTLGDYEKKIKSIKLKNKEATPEEKENAIIDKLITEYKVDIPKLLIDEEVNSRLSSMLERLEKLGLSLENYLAQIKKTGEELRDEYALQAEKAITLDLILQYIAVEEKIAIKDAEVESYMQTAQMSPEQRETVMLFLRKRKALEKLSKLV